jgi:RNase P subunit RPR2
MSKCNSLTSARLNYLYQSASVILQESKNKGNKKFQIKNKNLRNKTNGKKICKNNEKVANYYSQLMVRIGQGAVQRLSKNLKRTICKGCRSLLIPGTNAEICKIDKKQRKFGSVCSMCKTKKMFPIKAQKKESQKT